MDISELFDLSGKVAVVTGGGDGIGKGSCEILAAAGASVVVSDISVEKARGVADAINAAGGSATAVACNVLEDADLVNLIDTAAYMERIYRINVFAPWRLCQLAVPEMGKSGYGSIINITSVSSINKEANMCVYSSSKAAMNHLAANLAYDFGPYGVRINCVGPGATRTGALESVLTPEIEAKMLRRTPIRRLGEVSDIVRTVLFFASPASAWISGQVLFVNGGGEQTLD